VFQLPELETGFPKINNIKILCFFFKLNSTESEIRAERHKQLKDFEIASLARKVNMCTKSERDGERNWFSKKKCCCNSNVEKKFFVLAKAFCAVTMAARKINYTEKKT
jgi:hypothetical protein